MSQGKIDFVLPTFKRPKALMSSLASLMAQTNPNWSANVVCDGYWDEEMDKIKAYYSDQPQIRWTILDVNNNDWGHTPRNVGMKMSQEEWVIMGGDDNYYAPIFVDDFLKQVTPTTIMVYCNMVHNWDNGQYYPVTCIPVPYNIDVGCFMVKTELAKQMEIEVKYKQIADGVFAEKYLKRFNGEAKHINKLLYTHN